MTEKNNHFSFKMDIVKDSEIIKKMRNPTELGFKDKTEMFRIIIRNYFDNPNKNSNLKEELNQAKLKFTQNKNELHNLTKRKLDAEVRITEYHADNLDVIGNNPSKLSKEAMNHHINNTTPYDNNAVNCPDCTWQTNSNDTINYQTNAITWHVKQHHKRNLTEDEADKLSRLLI